MQHFIDNWSASLLAPATAEAVSLSVEPSLAARLVGFGEGDFYELTLVEHDAAGIEIDWEVVTVTGRAAGVLAVTRSGTARAWASGALIEARLTASAMETLRDAAGGTTVGSSAPQALGSASAGTSPQASRQDHVHPAPTPGDIGAATAAQGDKADSAVQPAALTAALAEKVDKVAGKGLSSNDYTTAEKNKLAGLEGSHFKGLHASLAALQSAHPSAMAGDYADVDAGAGVDVVRYLWDVTDSEWVAQASAGGSMTAAQVKAAYESNPDTNAFTDAEQAKLGGIAAGATANADTDSLAEGATNKYFTEGRVRSTVLTGLSLLAGGVISAADSALSALGKLQKQISDAVTAIDGKQDTLVSGTNLKTVNGNSLLGSGDLTVSGGASNATQTVAISSGALNLSATTAEIIVVDLNQSVTNITMPAGVSGQAVNRRIMFTQSGASNFTVAGWSSVTIEGGTAPVAAKGVGAVTEYMLSNTNNSGWRMYVDQGITLAQVGQLGGFRNKIINGKMEFSQRGTSFPATPLNSYTLDRWILGGAGTDAVVGISQAGAAGAGLLYSLSVAVSTAAASIAAGQALNIQQRIEGFNVFDLIGNAFTLSFWVYASKAGTYCASFTNSGTDRSYVSEYTVSSPLTWEKKSITVSTGLITDGTWNWTTGVGLVVRFTLAASSVVQTTPGTWQTGNFQTTSNQVNCLDTVGNIFAITGVQLEVGAVATPFEHRPYGVELALCRRYGRPLPPTLLGQCFAASAAAVYTDLDTPMRATPSLSTTAGYTLSTAGGGNVACSAALSSLGGGTRLQLDASGASGLTAGNATIMATPAGAFLSAEL